MVWCLKNNKRTKAKLKTRDQINDDHVNDHNPQHETDYRVWLPSAENILETSGIRMRTRYEYDDGFPEGLITHTHAGWMLKRGYWMKPFPFLTPSTKALVKMSRDYAHRVAKQDKYNYLVMDVFGNVYQSRPLSKGGYHAGKSHWKGIGYNVSRKLAGIEILNPGKLIKKGDKYYTWFKLEIPREYVRYVTKEEGYPHTGYFCACTREQEDSLKKLCKEMRACSSTNAVGGKIFRYDYVLGHDEVAPTRKTDPGGALSIPMSKLRELLIE